MNPSYGMHILPQYKRVFLFHFQQLKFEICNEIIRARHVERKQIDGDFRYKILSKCEHGHPAGRLSNPRVQSSMHDTCPTFNPTVGVQFACLTSRN